MAKVSDFSKEIRNLESYVKSPDFQMLAVRFQKIKNTKLASKSTSVGRIWVPGCWFENLRRKI